MCFYCEGLQLHTFSHRKLIKAMDHLPRNLIFYGFLLLFLIIGGWQVLFPIHPSVRVIPARRARL